LAGKPSLIPACPLACPLPRELSHYFPWTSFSHQILSNPLSLGFQGSLVCVWWVLVPRWGGRPTLGGLGGGLWAFSWCGAGAQPWAGWVVGFISSAAAFMLEGRVGWWVGERRVLPTVLCTAAVWVLGQGSVHSCGRPGSRHSLSARAQLLQAEQLGVRAVAGRREKRGEGARHISAARKRGTRGYSARG
jgi:hypothetical protein